MCKENVCVCKEECMCERRMYVLCKENVCVCKENGMCV